MENSNVEHAGELPISALKKTLFKRAISQGSITLPAVPAMIDMYEDLCLDLFEAIGVDFDQAQTSQLRTALQEQLAIAFDASPRSEIVITYDSPIGLCVNYHVAARWASIEHSYDHWVATREPPYFGVAPDAKVMAVAQQRQEVFPCAVLDIGAGTGRNALALAHLGHQVDALDLSSSFVEALRSSATEAGLHMRVFQQDPLTDSSNLRSDYGLIVLSEVVTDFRTVQQLERLFTLACDHLAPGGTLVLNAFLADDSYTPDTAAIQLGQQTYSSIFTRDEVQRALTGLALTLVEDSSVLAFERQHQPAEHWPPTSWYESWVQGLDTFTTQPAHSPVELRWLVINKATTN